MFLTVMLIMHTQHSMNTGCQNMDYLKSLLQTIEQNLWTIINYFCHLSKIKDKPIISYAPWTNGIVEGMNRSLQDYLRYLINGNDKKNIDWSTDVKLVPLEHNSQITTTFGLSHYELVSNLKPCKLIFFSAKTSKNAQEHCQPTRETICTL